MVSTSAAPITTTALPPVETLLTSTGIGAATFGELAYDDFQDVMVPELGRVTGALQMSYVADGDSYLAVDGPPVRFDYPQSRTVCFQQVVCAYFGGQTDQSLVFVGYRQSDGTATVGTSSGVQVGSVLSDHRDTIELDDAPCGTLVRGEADGVSLQAELLSGEAGGSNVEGVVVVLKAGSTPERETDQDC